MRRIKGKQGRMKRLLLGLLAAMLVAQAAEPVYALNKDDDNIHIENGTETAIGDTTIKVEDDGDVLITMTAKTATNSWRWRTVGYYITKKPLQVNADSLTGAAERAGSSVTTSRFFSRPIL